MFVTRDNGVVLSRHRGLLLSAIAFWCEYISIVGRVCCNGDHVVFHLRVTIVGIKARHRLLTWTSFRMLICGLGSWPHISRWRLYPRLLRNWTKSYSYECSTGGVGRSPHKAILHPKWIVEQTGCIEHEERCRFQQKILLFVSKTLQHRPRLSKMLCTSVDLKYQDRRVCGDGLQVE